MQRSLRALVKFSGLDEEAAMSCPAAGFVLAFRQGDFLHIKQVRPFPVTLFEALPFAKVLAYCLFYAGVQRGLADRSCRGSRHKPWFHPQVNTAPSSSHELCV